MPINSPGLWQQNSLNINNLKKWKYRDIKKYKRQFLRSKIMTIIRIYLISECGLEIVSYKITFSFILYFKQYFHWEFQTTKRLLQTKNI